MSVKNRAVKRRKLYDLQGGLCIHCGRPMPAVDDESVGPGLRPTIEHVIPRSLGGPHAMTNLAVAHGYCNFKRDVGPLWRKAKKRAAELRELVAQTQN